MLPCISILTDGTKFYVFLFKAAVRRKSPLQAFGKGLVHFVVLPPCPVSTPSRGRKCFDHFPHSVRKIGRCPTPGKGFQKTNFFLRAQSFREKRHHWQIQKNLDWKSDNNKIMSIPSIWPSFRGVAFKRWLKSQSQGRFCIVFGHPPKKNCGKLRKNCGKIAFFSKGNCGRD